MIPRHREHAFLRLCKEEAVCREGLAWLPAAPLQSRGLPQAGGWIASEVVQEEETTGRIIHRGLKADNERLADFWRLDLPNERQQSRG